MINTWPEIIIYLNKLQRWKLKKSEPLKYEDWEFLGTTYKGLECYGKAIEAFNQALSINPEHAFALYGLGTTYWKLDRYDDAIEAFRQALKVDTNNTEAWYTLGVAYLFTGNRKGALDTAKELQCFDSPSADKLFNMIETYDGLKKTEECEDIMQVELFCSNIEKLIN